MKKLFIIPLIIVIASTGCKKDSPVIAGQPPPTPAPTPPVANKAPVVNAGRDITINLPVDQIWLDGSASFDPDGTITLFQWQKISGPEARGNAILYQNFVKSRVTLTVPGIYQFQLTISDNAGAVASDTLHVVVNDFTNPAELSGKEFVFDDLVGVYDWDSYGTFISTPDKPDLFLHPYFKVEVFLKPYSALNWIPVKSFKEVKGNTFLNPYYYLIEGHRMYIIEFSPADQIFEKKSSVKVRFL